LLALSSCRLGRRSAQFLEGSQADRWTPPTTRTRSTHVFGRVGGRRQRVHQGLDLFALHGARLIAPPLVHQPGARDEQREAGAGAEADEADHHDHQGRGARGQGGAAAGAAWIGAPLRNGASGEPGVRPMRASNVGLPGCSAIKQRVCAGVPQEHGGLWQVRTQRRQFSAGGPLTSRYRRGWAAPPR
jgi:hypothetical protein